MRLNSAPTLFFVASMMYVSVFMTTQDATASSDTFYATGRAIGTDVTTFLKGSTDGPFPLTAFGTDIPGAFSGIAFQPGTGTLFASSGNNFNPAAPNATLYTVNTDTGATTQIGTGFDLVGATTTDLAFGNDGTLYGTDYVNLWGIDTTTGVATIIGPFVNEDELEALAVDPTTGILYGMDWRDAGLYIIDTTSGEATLQGNFTELMVEAELALVGFAIDSAGSFFISTGGGNGDIYAIDPANYEALIADMRLGDAIDDAGVSDIAFRVEGGGGPTADFDSDTDVDGADFLEWQRELGTSLDATDLANWQSEYALPAAAAAASAVPEPSALALLMLGAMGLVSLRKANR